MWFTREVEEVDVIWIWAQVDRRPSCRQWGMEGATSAVRLHSTGSIMGKTPL